MPNVFYGKKNNDKIFLDEKETSHLKVVRKIPGEEINVITGDGFVYTAIIDSIKKKETILSIKNKTSVMENFTPYLSIYFGMSKWDRTQILLEKLVELRVNEFNVYFGDKSEIKYINLEKFQRTIIEASKQTIYASIPIINMIKFEQIPQENTIVLDFVDNKRTFKDFIKYRDENQKINIVIGPDAGFSKQEKEFFFDNNYLIINLGKAILRFETAAIYAVSAINYEFNRLYQN
ncbi:MAG: 16S rRNA (uracil(1498)-N(3))-methyltransferase [Defluviitoga tunisiensis]|jgi:16S rRNA (uracil1498-N3)-methyltransferase|uniref:Ribosomal RNA small subunit methyltransferase E n=1 Tax=Defluviitoga tunisiensis TaxID=1006576 RepID=A0A0C7P078_DEFTU|nr:16S rRNA (uracil(1498)-N(3))-methyltransferase [Defluviitoga tunisiensis]MDD3601575.1 16S rRNA (uracil(1498)-N(3))-methyltransferase [Defluviitoga tunisiensis]MDY0380156.1 16S rRNA (uracil(1498)-N(3))-methyltransferase [Defluviitoga tunisiensis]CEP77429.1 16S ribosomal RNA methyltransferase RsmE [Defluviitoga tunisiensis]HOB55884.1 16S rRNA (uracil(1498)-N(3))-methyltransferase [Defluviitoga tunisiensis]HPZ66996.1 16S rRNA (uracil(1498)-N(3))-methyltransferase [Defluviitoga tunisiensis]